MRSWGIIHARWPERHGLGGQTGCQWKALGKRKTTRPLLGLCDGLVEWPRLDRSQLSWLSFPDCWEELSGSMSCRGHSCVFRLTPRCQGVAI